jgi:uncharacterized protein (DUF58 family)
MAPRTWSLRPTWRTITLAALGVPVALLPTVVHARLWPFWPVALAGFVLLVGADALLAPKGSGVSAQASVPSTLAIGGGGHALVTVRIPSQRPVPVLVALDLSSRLVPQPPQNGFASHQGSEITFRLVPTRRGAAKVERAWIRYRGPLGLMASVVAVDLDREAVVVPNLEPVYSAALRFADRSFRAGLKIERYIGDGTEFESLREHFMGDDPRSLDWKASARHLKLVARQFRAERNHQIIIALDTGRLMSEPIAGVPKLDHAVTAALLLSYVSLRAGDRVGWITFDARIGRFVEPQSGVRGFGVLRQAAGRIDYTEVETNYTLGLTSLAQRLSRRSLVVVITDFVDSMTAELMMENMDRLARRHAVVFVALQDPGLAAAAGLPPGSLLALNRAVVAGVLLRDREVLLKRLRQQGIEPIDAAPAEVSTRLVNAYLEIKRRERI